MRLFERERVFGFALLTVGTVLVGKFIHDVKKIKAIAAEKEAALAAEAEVVEEAIEETEAVEEIAEEAAEEAEVAEEAAEEVTEEAEAAEEAAEEATEEATEEAAAI